MPQLREAMGTNPVPVPGVRQIAAMLGLAKPTSLRNLIQTLDQPNVLDLVITTPSGTALGGSAHLELRKDGGYTFSGHMHDSGFDPYDFRVLAVAQSSTVAMVFQHTGHVDGTGSDPLGSPNRDNNWNETRNNPVIAANWLEARSAKLSVSKSYQDTGVIKLAADALRLITGWWMTEALFGPEIAVVIVGGSELGDITGIKFADPSGLPGVAVAGATILVFGPNVILPAVIAGAVVASEIKHRSLQDEEKALAALVFGDTLPTDRIVLTNLPGLGGRAFTIPSFDNSILINLGSAYDAPDPLHHTEGAYPTAGQLFIHELTHAWQIEYADFVPGWFCDAVAVQTRYTFGEDVYTPGAAGRDWHRFTLEQQGRVVDQWFGTYASGWTDVNDAKAKLNSKNALQDPFFPYIANNVRLAQG